MKTATTSIAACAHMARTTALKSFNPRTPEMLHQRHAGLAGLLLAATALHRMESEFTADGLDDTCSLLLVALHGVEALRSWYLYDLAQGHSPASPTASSTTEGQHHA